MKTFILVEFYDTKKNVYNRLSFVLGEQKGSYNKQPSFQFFFKLTILLIVQLLS